MPVLLLIALFRSYAGMTLLRMTNFGSTALEAFLVDAFLVYFVSYDFRQSDVVHPIHMDIPFFPPDFYKLCDILNFLNYFRICLFD